MLTTTFQFHVSATKHVKLRPPPTAAGQLRPAAVSPSQGRGGTSFAVRYRADIAPYNSGDVIEVDGPKRSACKGDLVRVSSLRPDERAGPLTAHVGRGAGDSFRWGAQAATASPAPDNGTGTPLHRWCPGTYKGTIMYETYTKFTVIARFELLVAQ